MAQPLFYLLLNEGYKKRAFVYPLRRTHLEKSQFRFLTTKKADFHQLIVNYKKSDTWRLLLSAASFRI